MPAPQPLEAVAINRLFLSLSNPRHKPVEAEAAAIAHLCSKESVYELARDITRHGVNPLDRLALVQIPRKPGSTGQRNYFVAEGNRRICALKLLNDPELAPAKMRSSFERLAKGWTPIKSVAGVVFEAASEVDL